ncbi:hypothetical protein X793_07285 [Dehalococcoides mccartyi CG4]|nr:hypothetical protein X793_07285 [Dehalococcoides mccartyi CG4]
MNFGEGFVISFFFLSIFFAIRASFTKSYVKTKHVCDMSAAERGILDGTIPILHRMVYFFIQIIGSFIAPLFYVAAIILGFILILIF